MAARERASETQDFTSSAGAILRVPVVIGETYRLTKLLGEGGMGEVYEAEHLRLGRRFALKLLRNSSDAKAISRFRRETRIIAELDSNHVVGVFDCGELPDGTPYLVMELLRGSDLRGVLREQGRLSIGRAVRAVGQAARGVTAAHRTGVIHRDLKPENLFLVRRDDDEETCKVLDFGVAKSETSDLTQQGAVVGTIKYMAPEQLEDSASVGPATDVYSLGAILYECLAGHPPHVAPTARETMFKILSETPRDLRDRRPDLPAELQAVVARAMARRAQDRYQTSAELERALAPFATLVSAEPQEVDGAPTTDLSAEGFGLPHAATLDQAGVRSSPLADFASKSHLRVSARAPVAARAGVLLALGLSLGVLGSWLVTRKVDSEPTGAAQSPGQAREPLRSQPSEQARDEAVSKAAQKLAEPALTSSPVQPEAGTAPAARPSQVASRSSPTVRERPTPKASSPAMPATTSGAESTKAAKPARKHMPNLSFDHDNPYAH